MGDIFLATAAWDTPADAGPDSSWNCEKRLLIEIPSSVKVGVESCTNKTMNEETAVTRRVWEVKMYADYSWGFCLQFKPIQRKDPRTRPRHPPINQHRIWVSVSYVSFRRDKRFYNDTEITSEKTFQQVGQNLGEKPHRHVSRNKEKSHPPQITSSFRLMAPYFAWVHVNRTKNEASWDSLPTVVLRRWRCSKLVSYKDL